MEAPNIIVLGEKEFRFTDLDGVIVNITITDNTYLKTYEEVYKTCKLINRFISGMRDTKEKLKLDLTDEERELECDIIKIAEKGIVLQRNILEMGNYLK